MKDAPRQQFRSAAHVSGTANVKPKDYEAASEPAAEIEAENEYAAWALLRNTENPLHVGDLLEIIPPEQLSLDVAPAPEAAPEQTPGSVPVKSASPSRPISHAVLYTGKLRICKYVGFEDARWFVPEPTQPSFPLPAPVTPFPAQANNVPAAAGEPRHAQA